MTTLEKLGFVLGCRPEEAIKQLANRIRQEHDGEETQMQPAKNERT